MDSSVSAYIERQMRPASKRIKQFGIPFKHNTGRAICYLYSVDYISDDLVQQIVHALESWHITTFDSWNLVKHVELRNMNDTIFQRFYEWDQSLDLGPINCDKIIKFHYLSLVVRMNYEFHIRLI